MKKWLSKNETLSVGGKNIKEGDPFDEKNVDPKTLKILDSKGFIGAVVVSKKTSKEEAKK